MAANRNAAGIVDGDPVVITSELDDGGTIFADGIESDRCAFSWGRSVTIGPAGRCQMLAVPA